MQGPLQQTAPKCSGNFVEIRINVECFSFNSAQFLSYDNYYLNLLANKKREMLKRSKMLTKLPLQIRAFAPPPPPPSHFPAPRNLIKSGGLDINCNGLKLTCINPPIARLGGSISCLELLLPVLMYKESPSNSLQSVPHSLSECM